MKNKTKHPLKWFLHCSSSRGASLLELALVLPIILVLLAAGIEYSRSMTTYSQMNSLMREITGNAFRDCAKFAGSSATSYVSDTNVCLQNVLAASNTTATNILPGAVIIVSAFRWQAAPGPTRFVTSQRNGGAGPPNSNIDWHHFDPDPTDFNRRENLLKLHNVLVYGEIFYTYKPIIPVIAGIFGYGGNRSFYVAAAF